MEPIPSWMTYSNQGAVRNDPLSPQLIAAMGFLGDMGIRMDVISGGQESNRPGEGTGSTRHNHGNAVDADFYMGNDRLSWHNPQHLPILQQIVQRARAGGITGIGAGDDYMGDGRLHLGFGNAGIWGADGRGANAPDWLREAYGQSGPAFTGGIPMTGGGGSDVMMGGTDARVMPGTPEFARLVAAVIQQESGGNPAAVNAGSGAAGLMQILQSTASDPGFGVAPMNWDARFDPAANQAFGEQYLGAMLQRYDGDVARALAAYNWGPGNADGWSGDVAALPAATQGYLTNIMGSMGMTGGGDTIAPPAPTMPLPEQPQVTWADMAGRFGSVARGTPSNIAETYDPYRVAQLFQVQR